MTLNILSYRYSRMGDAIKKVCYGIFKGVKPLLKT